jgi:hypothetical protein
VNLNLQAQNGNPPYTWNYLNLPSQLSGDNSGNIKGSFDQEGYYSFSASAADSKGNAVDSYYTLNIQPKTLVNSNLIDVPNRNVPVQYDLNQVESQQLAATNAVYAAIALVSDNQKNVTDRRSDLAKTTLALQFATAQENGIEDKVAAAIANKNLADSTAAKAEQVVENAKKILALTQTALANADDNLDQAKKDLVVAED